MSDLAWNILHANIHSLSNQSVLLSYCQVDMCSVETLITDIHLHLRQADCATTSLKAKCTGTCMRAYIGVCVSPFVYAVTSVGAKAYAIVHTSLC